MGEQPLSSSAHNLRQANRHPRSAACSKPMQPLRELRCVAAASSAPEPIPRARSGRQVCRQPLRRPGDRRTPRDQLPVGRGGSLHVDQAPRSPKGIPTTLQALSPQAPVGRPALVASHPATPLQGSPQRLRSARPARSRGRVAAPRRRKCSADATREAARPIADWSRVRPARCGLRQAKITP